MMPRLTMILFIGLACAVLIVYCKPKKPTRDELDDAEESQKSSKIKAHSKNFPLRPIDELTATGTDKPTIAALASNKKSEVEAEPPKAKSTKKRDHNHSADGLVNALNQWASSQP